MDITKAWRNLRKTGGRASFEIEANSPRDAGESNGGGGGEAVGDRRR